MKTTHAGPEPQRSAISSLALTDLWWNRQLQRWLDAVDCRKAPLVYGQRKPSARVDIDQRRFQRYVAERLHKSQIELLVAQNNWNHLATLIAELQEIFGIHVGHQVAERPIGRDHFPVQSLLIDLSCFEIQTHQRIQVE